MSIIYKVQVLCLLFFVFLGLYGVMDIYCFCVPQRGFDCMDPFIPLSVPNYSEKEFESCYQYYLDRRWLQHPQSNFPLVSV